MEKAELYLPLVLGAKLGEIRSSALRVAGDQIFFYCIRDIAPQYNNKASALIRKIREDSPSSRQKLETE